MQINGNNCKYFFKQILELSNDGFIVVDKDCMIADINTPYQAYIGKPREDIVGHHIKDVFGNSKMPCVLKHRLANHTEIDSSLGEDISDDMDRVMLVGRSCVFDNDGNVIGGISQVHFGLDMVENAKKILQEYTKQNMNEFSDEQKPSSFDAIVGKNEAFLQLCQHAKKAAQSDFEVLLSGETGTGKEVLAHAIHNESKRASGPMVSINCAAIPSELLESELFGYKEGAFTGARKGGKVGKFQLANGGTLFLDEIGDMPLLMQAKILRAIQEKEIEPIGGSEPVSVDIRIISASRKDLGALVREGKFREDLYYRLNVINLTLPPLRERKDDIEEFVDYFLDKLNRKYNGAVILARDVEKYLRMYPWPGNIRELENVVKAAYATCDHLTIEKEDLPSKIVNRTTEINGENGAFLPLHEQVEEFERQQIHKALVRNNGNRQETAAELGIHRSALYKKIVKLNIVDSDL